MNQNSIKIATDAFRHSFMTEKKKNNDEALFFCDRDMHNS